MIPESVHTFFLASSGVAATLIGLLFVAISVSAVRFARAEAKEQLYRIRASAALTAFINALAVSLFALIPGHKIGPAAAVMAAIGLAFVMASLLSLIHLRQLKRGTMRDGPLLLGLAATFVIQLIKGAEVIAQPGNSGAVNTIAVLVVVCFLIGIFRAWELVGGPFIRLTKEATTVVRGRERDTDNPTDGEPAP